MKKNKQRLIIHIDGDSFFVACELLARPDLIGKPVVTGYERGIASAMSYEAKQLGITRAFPIFKLRKLFPQVTVLHSSYGLYEQYSQKMLAVARRFSNNVEDYSIDECFLDISDVAKNFDEGIIIAKELKETLQKELGLTFSLGLANTKVLAKIASAYQKPNGFSVITPDKVDAFLADNQIRDIWGIGYRMEKHFQVLGIKTALQFKQKDFAWVEKLFATPYQDIWNELNGISVLPVRTIDRTLKSLQATRTFPKFSNDKEYVFSHLSRNVEIACTRLRESGLLTNHISLYLKDKDLKYYETSITLPALSAYQANILPLIRKGFERVWKSNIMYKTTGITCHNLVVLGEEQKQLFIDPHEKKSAYDAVDQIRNKFGEYSIILASSMQAVKSFQQNGQEKIHIKQKLFPLPFLGQVQ